MLYQDIFGKFAYIAPDIPLFTIILAGIITYISPATAMLRVVVTVILVFAAGYAVWLVLYISKHKKNAIKNGTWETAALSADDERIWKRSEPVSYTHLFRYNTKDSAHCNKLLSLLKNKTLLSVTYITSNFQYKIFIRIFNEIDNEN